jgi:hypothetical protein
VHSALNKNYNIIVVKDCHTTTNRPHLSAEKVIQHHNWLWENMMPTNGKIKLVSSKDLLRKQNIRRHAAKSFVGPLQP